MSDTVPSLCDSCQRRKSTNTCSAFPKQIPEDILVYGVDHRVPVEGDNGKQYVQKDGTDVELSEWQSYHDQCVKVGLIPKPETRSIRPNRGR